MKKHIFILVLFFCLPAFVGACRGPAGTAEVLNIRFTPGPACENGIIDRLNSARKIDIAVYAITNDNIFNALTRAKERGADVRIVTDRLQAKGRSSKVPELTEAGFAVKINKKLKIEHNKFAVFDGTAVATGSYNWTTAATLRNSENCLFIADPDRIYENRFEELWTLY